MFNIKSFFKFWKNKGSKKPIRVSKDPVCGMRITEDIDFVHEGINYSFCSDHCRQQFQQDPRSYISK